MNNKVLIKLIVPEMDAVYDLFIPVNELVWKIKKLIIKAVNDLSGSTIIKNDNYCLMNKMTGEIYKNNQVILNTNIRNATEIVLLSSD